MPKPTRICSYEGCERATVAHQLCSGHYQQRRSGQDLRPLRVYGSPTERFWSKVNKDSSGGCWEWIGATGGNGYGQFYLDGGMKYCHRISWGWVNGPIPERMMIDHRCANRLCVNPGHLRVVDRSQNQQHLTGPYRTSKSGVRGVHWHQRKNAWAAEVALNGRSYWGGYHSTLEAAERAVKALRARLHTHDDHDEWLQTQG